MVATEDSSARAVPTAPTRRLFFALWPDEAMRQAMERATGDAARVSGGRPVAAADLHATLAFLGAVPERRLPELVAVARKAAAVFAGAVARPLELTFDRLEYWRSARVLCALSREPPEWTVALVRMLQELLIESGFAPKLKSPQSTAVNIDSPFQPHVTVARKVYRSPRAMGMQRVTWRGTDIVLVDSKTLPEGAIYAVLERFVLEP